MKQNFHTKSFFLHKSRDERLMQQTQYEMFSSLPHIKLLKYNVFQIKAETIFNGRMYTVP
jgi:hypothetical protein